jgi:hypothetical protein
MSTLNDLLNEIDENHQKKYWGKIQSDVDKIEKQRLQSIEEMKTKNYYLKIRHYIKKREKRSINKPLSRKSAKEIKNDLFILFEKLNSVKPNFDKVRKKIKKKKIEVLSYINDQVFNQSINKIDFEKTDQIIDAITMIEDQIKEESILDNIDLFEDDNNPIITPILPPIWETQIDEPEIKNNVNQRIKDEVSQIQNVRNTLLIENGLNANIQAKIATSSNVLLPSEMNNMELIPPDENILPSENNDAMDLVQENIDNEILMPSSLTGAEQPTLDQEIRNIAIQEFRKRRATNVLRKWFQEASTSIKWLENKNSRRNGMGQKNSWEESKNSSISFETASKKSKRRREEDDEIELEMERKKSFAKKDNIQIEDIIDNPTIEQLEYTVEEPDDLFHPGSEPSRKKVTIRNKIFQQRLQIENGPITINSIDNDNPVEPNIEIQIIDDSPFTSAHEILPQNEPEIERTELFNVGTSAKEPETEERQSVKKVEFEKTLDKSIRNSKKKRKEELSQKRIASLEALPQNTEPTFNRTWKIRDTEDMKQENGEFLLQMQEAIEILNYFLSQIEDNENMKQQIRNEAWAWSRWKDKTATEWAEYLYSIYQSLQVTQNNDRLEPGIFSNQSESIAPVIEQNTSDLANVLNPLTTQHPIINENTHISIQNNDTATIDSNIDQWVNDVNYFDRKQKRNFTDYQNLPDDLASMTGSRKKIREDDFENPPTEVVEFNIGSRPEFMEEEPRRKRKIKKLQQIVNDNPLPPRENELVINSITNETANVLNTYTGVIEEVPLYNADQQDEFNPDDFLTLQKPPRLWDNVVYDQGPEITRDFPKIKIKSKIGRTARQLDNRNSKETIDTSAPRTTRSGRQYSERQTRLRSSNPY